MVCLRFHAVKKMTLEKRQFFGTCQCYLCITEQMNKNFCVLYIGTRLFPAVLTLKFGCVPVHQAHLERGSAL